MKESFKNERKREQQALPPCIEFPGFKKITLESGIVSKHRLMKSLKNMNMTQHVTVVTRPKSNSCLDHVYTTHGHFVINISVPCIGLSDHLPVFLCRNYVKLNLESGHKRINYLDFKNLNAEAMLSDLKDLPWDSAFVFDDVDDTLDALELILSEVVKKHIPKKQKRVKKTKQPAWIDEKIVSVRKKRDRELKIARKTNCPNDWSKYKCTKCYVTNLVRISKRMHFQQSIDDNKRKPKRNLEGAEISHQVSEVLESHRTQKGRWYS